VTRPAVPAYTDLPVLDGLGLRHAWGVFGADDDLGTLNHLDDATVLAALGEARTGTRINLSLEMTAIDPPLYGREPLQHTLIRSNRNTWDDRLDSFYPQSASQWDGLRHIRAREFGFFGGITDDPPAMGARLGIGAFARRGIVGRGVLLDVAGHLQGDGYDPLDEVSVTADMLREVAEAQQVEIRPGDLLCVRFGWLSAYRNMDPHQRREYAAAGQASTFAGLGAEESTAQALWDWQLAAVACDNPGAEVSPGDPSVGSLHRRLLPLLGFAVGELFDLDELAAACSADGRWSFLMISVPLHVDGAIGSPANAVAIR
jgi:kynurenine formamidase